VVFGLKSIWKYLKIAKKKEFIMQILLNIKNEKIFDKLLWMLEHFKSDGVEIKTLKDNQVDIGADFRDTSSLNDIANFYFDNKCNTNLKWQIERRRLYKVYFKNEL